MSRPLQKPESGRPTARRRSLRGGRLLAVPVSLAAHVAILSALVWVRTDPPEAPETQAMIVALVDGPLLSDPVKVPNPTPPTAAPTPQRPMVRRTPAPPDVEPLLVDVEPAEEPAPQLSDAQLAGAATADSGPTGRACNMVRWLQAALRRDADVQAAVAHAHRTAGPAAKAIMVWNGDWIRSPGQEGAGLAGVREAIMVEIAFAPEPCRADPVRGLVLISLADAPGSPRLVVGSGEWRWSDLLHPRSGAAGAALRR